MKKNESLFLLGLGALMIIDKIITKKTKKEDDNPFLLHKEKDDEEDNPFII